MHQLSVICDCNWQGDEKRQRRCHGRTERVWFKSAVSWNDANIKAERDSYTWCLYDDDDDSPKLYTDGVEGAVRPLNCQLRVTLTREVCSVSQSHLTDIQTHIHTYTLYRPVNDNRLQHMHSNSNTWCQNELVHGLTNRQHGPYGQSNSLWQTNRQIINTLSCVMLYTARLCCHKVSVCPSIHHDPVPCQNGWRYHWRFFTPNSPITVEFYESKVR